MIKLNSLEKTIIRSITAYLLYSFSILWQYIPITIFHLNITNMSLSIRILLSLFSQFITFFIFFFMYRKELKKELSIFRKNLVENLDIAFRYWIIGLIIMIITNSIIMIGFKAKISGNEQLVQQMINSLPLFMLVDSGFLAPFNEEIVYRKTIKDIVGNHKWVFVITSALIFGSIHVLGNTKSLVEYLYIIPYGSFGAVFSLAYYKTDTIFTSLSMHMVHNLLLTFLSIIL